MLCLSTALTPAMALDISSQPAVDPALELEPFVEAMVKLLYPAVISGNGKMAGFVRLVPSGGTSAAESYLWDGTTATMLDSIDGAGAPIILGLSDDGETAVGMAGSRGFRRTAAGGYTLLDELTEEPVNLTELKSFSDNAAIIVGHAFAEGAEVGFPTPVFWDSTGAIHSLLSSTDPDWTTGTATLVSGDGKVVYGRVSDVADGANATDLSALVRWSNIETATPGQLIISVDAAAGVLGFTPKSVIANDTTYDGSVMIGYGDADQPQALLWTLGGGGETGTFRKLDLPDGFEGSFGSLISKAGEVGVGLGITDTDSGFHVLRWELGAGGDTLDISRTSKTVGSSHAADSEETIYDVVTGMSEDGSIIVGTNVVDFQNVLTSPTTAFRWSDADGWQTISEFLASHDVDVEGWTFDSTGSIMPALGGTLPQGGRNISADGSVIIGRGTRALGEGQFEDIYWLTRCTSVEENCGVTTEDDIYEGVVSVGSMAEVSNLYFDDLFSTLSHTSGQAGPNGSMFGWGAGDSDPMSSAGLGINLRLGSTMTGSLAVSRAHIVTPLAFDGEAAFDATAISAYFADRPTSGLVWDAGVSAAALTGEVGRGYLNGNDVEFSSGETDGSALGARARLGWRFADVAPQTAVTPYAGYTFARSSYEGWTETGGSFPAVFSDFTTLTHIVRAGVDVEHDFTGGVVGTAGLAVVRRTTDSGTMTFDLPGIIGGDVSAETGPATWAEVNLGLTVPLAETATGLFGVTGRIPEDGDVSVAGHAALNFAF